MISMRREEQEETLSGIYDFHCHILPGIDDGSRDMEMTDTMLSMEKEQGVDHILFTPHFYAQKQSATEFIRHRGNAFDRVKGLIEAKGYAIETRAAAETFFFKGISEAGILDDLCMNTSLSQVLFLEMPFAQWRRSMYEEVKALIEKRGLTVVLVHIERFIGFQKDRTVWDEIFSMPVAAQHNAGIYKSIMKRGAGIRTIKEHWPVILGTDAHNTSSRPPCMEDGRRVIEKKLGRAALSRIDMRSARLWDDGTIN